MQACILVHNANCACNIARNVLFVPIIVLNHIYKCLIIALRRDEILSIRTIQEEIKCLYL